MTSVADLIAACDEFRLEAETILGFSEVSIHRVAELSKSYERLDAISAIQSDMLRQALRCVEVGVFRGAHVLAWAALADYVQFRAADDGFAALNSARPKWAIGSMDDLRDMVGEHNLIEGMHSAKLITKSEKKALLALLNKRNECAHPTDYFPDLNQTLGYVAECVSRLDSLTTKYGVTAQ